MVLNAILTDVASDGVVDAVLLPVESPQKVPL